MKGSSEGWRAKDDLSNLSDSNINVQIAMNNIVLGQTVSEATYQGCFFFLIRPEARRFSIGDGYDFGEYVYARENTRKLETLKRVKE